MVSVIGQPVGRVDGPAKVTGHARFAADVLPAATLWGAVLRSPHAHARITQVDTARARAVPGVHAVLCGQDLGEHERLYGRAIADIPILAVDRVRYRGEPVAAVAAESRAAAAEALALIDVAYAPLPAVFDPFLAMQPDAPILHPHFREYRRVTALPGWVGTPGSDDPATAVPNLVATERITRGDVEAGFRAADLVVEHTYTTPFQHQGYLEPNSCVVAAEPDGTLRIWASNKTPFTARDVLARDLGLPVEKVVFEHTFVGGDFGGKGSPMQVPLGSMLSRATGRPVRLIMDAVAEMTAANPRHAAWITLRSGLRRDGTLLARQVQVVFDSGAYAGIKPVPGGILSATQHQACGVYQVPHFSYESRMVYTNHLPGGFMRLPGGVQVAFACEVEMDRLAEAVGVDPLEMRRRNGVEEGSLSALGEPWTGVRLKECLQAVTAAAGWDAPRPAGSGRGLAAAQEAAGGGGSTSIVQVHPDGSATLVTSVSDQGNGAYTILAQIVAEELQLPLHRVHLDVRGTADGPWDRGSSAQSVTRMAGGATLQAVRLVRDQLATVAAEYLGCPEDQVRLVDGVFTAAGTRTDQSLRFADVARSACRDGQPVSASYRTEDAAKARATGFVAQVAQVQVDRETGQVTVQRLVSATDVGTVLNPLGLTGQLEGGSVMGLGIATTEELKMDADGRVETVALSEYKLPTARDVPELQTILITDAAGPGPYGAKAVGEMGLICVPAAVANAVYDAVGVRITDLPITAEKVYQALRQQEQAQAQAQAHEAADR